MEIDATDKKIMNVLLANASSSYRTIAKKAGVSLGTVMNRMRKLKAERVIRKSTILVDYEKIGLTLGVMIDVRVGKGKLLEAENMIARHPNVFAVYDVTGDFDASILARFASRRELDRFVKNLQKNQFVERTNTKLILNCMKEEQSPFPVGMRPPQH